ATTGSSTRSSSRSPTFPREPSANAGRLARPHPTDPSRMMASPPATRMARQMTSPWARRYKVRALLATLLGIAVASGGCAARRHTDTLEARLRQQEDRLVAVHRDLIAVRRERDLARAET